MAYRSGRRIDIGTATIYPDGRIEGVLEKPAVVWNALIATHGKFSIAPPTIEE